MHNTTHIDAPAHVIQARRSLTSAAAAFLRSGIVVSIPREEVEQITYDDLERPRQGGDGPRDVVIVNTGWQKLYGGQRRLFLPRARLRVVGGRMVRREER
jgi:kynurenine formamidase